MRNSGEWTEQDILDLIENKVKENIGLDFKRCDALEKTDGRIKDISKDVSAFANSAGGTLVDGVIEDGFIATSIDRGYHPAEISKRQSHQMHISSTTLRQS